MFNSIFDESKEVKYFKKITDFKDLSQVSYNAKYFKELKRLNSPKIRGIFRIKASSCDEAFL